MKKIFIGIFMLTIVGLFAATHFNTSKHEGDPGKKQTIVKNEVKQPTKEVVLTCAEELQHQIALCYGTTDEDVLIGSVGEYYIYSLDHHGSMSITDCGKNCTYICIGVVPNNIACCFTINCDYP